MGKKHRKNKRLQRESYHNQGYTMQNTSGTYWENCHDGPIGVFDVGQSTIYAGSQFEIDTPAIRFDIFICANGDKGKFVSAVQLEDKRGLLKATEQEITNRLTPTFLTMDIMDGGVPAVGSHFWKSLVTDLRDKQLNVAVYCRGGHGRTGVVLACLAWFAGMVREHGDIVQFVRNCYCIDAIETMAQINYLKQLGMTTDQLPSFKPVVIGAPQAAIHYTGPIVPTQATTATVPVTIQEGSQGVVAVVGDTIPASERVSTKEELMEWEKELIEEQAQRDKDHDGSLWDKYDA